MENKNEFKKINFKNDDIMEVHDTNFDRILLDEKYYRNISVYKILLKKMQNQCLLGSIK